MTPTATLRDSFLDNVRRAISIGTETPNLTDFINNEVVQDFRYRDFESVVEAWTLLCLVEDFRLMVTKLQGMSVVSTDEKILFRKDGIRLLSTIDGILTRHEKTA